MYGIIKILDNNNEVIMFAIDSFKGCISWHFDTFESDERCKDADKIINELKDQYECIGLGRNRIVFKMRSGNYVLKFPLGCNGESDNDWEGSVVTNKNHDLNDGSVITPKTRWLSYKGFICVLMEYIDENIDEYPEWSASVDCQQVGVNKKGQILAFDFGLR